MLLKTFFENPFDLESITSARLKNFAEDNVLRLLANNTGNVYDTIIANTQTRINGLQTAINAKGSEIGDRSGSAETKDQKRVTLQIFISNQEGLVKSTFGKKSGVYKEIFPQGLSAFHKADDEAFQSLATILLGKATKYEAQLGAGFKTQLSTLLNDFVTAETAVGTDKGDVDSENIEVLASTHDLQLQLIINIHTVALQNDAGPADVIATTFFDESLLYAEHTRHISKGEVAPHSAKPVRSVTYHASNHFNIEHKSAGALKWRMRLNGVPVGNEFITNIGQKLNKSFSDFAPDGDELVVINDEDVAGEYRVVEIS